MTQDVNSDSTDGRLASFAEYLRHPLMQRGYAWMAGAFLVYAAWFALNPAAGPLVEAFTTMALGAVGLRVWAVGGHRWLGRRLSAALRHVPAPTTWTRRPRYQYSVWRYS